MLRTLAAISASALLAAGCTGEAPPDPVTSPTTASASPTGTPTPPDGTATASPTAGPSPAPSDDEAAIGTLAWVDRTYGQDDDQVPRLVVLDVPDGEQRELNPRALTGTAWSPSGDRVAVIGRPQAAEGPGQEELRVVDVATGDATVVATGNFSFPHWSPDGRRLVVTTTEPGQPAPIRVAVVDVETSDLTPVTDPAEDADDLHPRWSPDGDRIAFVRRTQADPTSDDPGIDRLLTISADGSDQRELAPGLFDEGPPDWSPDGRTIALAAATSPDVEAPSEVHLVPVDGGPAERLGVAGARGEALFSPDGQRLAVAAGDLPDSSDIHVVEVPSGDALAVLDADELDISPTWAPGGQHLAFLAATGLEGQADVALATLPSGEIRLLTNDGSVESPAFAPR